MLEFLEVLNVYVVRSFQGLALIASILFFHKYKHTALRYLPLILGCTFILELFGSYLYELLAYNALFFNIYNILFFSYFYYVFYHFLKTRANKKWVLMCAPIYSLIVIIDFFSFDFVEESQLYSYFAGACLLISCIILYFIEMLRSSRVLSMRQDLMFWISTGLLLFYVGYLPIKLTRVAFWTEDHTYMILTFVHFLLIIFMNIFFILGLVWKRKN